MGSNFVIVPTASSIEVVRRGIRKMGDDEMDSQEILAELNRLGIAHGPVTGTTKRLYMKKIEAFKKNELNKNQNVTTTSSRRRTTKKSSVSAAPVTEDNNSSEPEASGGEDPPLGKGGRGSSRVARPSQAAASSELKNRRQSVLFEKKVETKRQKAPAPRHGQQSTPWSSGAPIISNSSSGYPVSTDARVDQPVVGANTDALFKTKKENNDLFSPAGEWTDSVRTSTPYSSKSNTQLPDFFDSNMDGIGRHHPNTKQAIDDNWPSYRQSQAYNDNSDINVMRKPLLSEFPFQRRHFSEHAYDRSNTDCGEFPHGHAADKDGMQSWLSEIRRSAFAQFDAVANRIFATFFNPDRRRESHPTTTTATAGGGGQSYYSFPPKLDQRTYGRSQAGHAASDVDHGGRTRWYWTEDSSKPILIGILTLLVGLLLLYLALVNKRHLHSTSALVVVALEDTAYFLFSRMVLPALVIVFVIGIILFLIWYSKYRWQRTAEEQRQTYELIEKIIDILRRHHDYCERTDTTQKPLPISHVRDMLIPLAKRREMMPIWNKAVQYLSENDSRVRTETQCISGEEFVVWRWMQLATSSLTDDNKVWQGYAFQDEELAKNMPHSPMFKYLKVRGLFDPDLETEDGWPRHIQDAILEKLGPKLRVCHMAIDTTSKEGVVFMKMASLEEASDAFKTLHGSWFNGRLVYVKFLRPERYNKRFPEAMNANDPIHIFKPRYSTILRNNNY
ncbi:Inner nuclear membrane protein Man1 [Trichinella murrelli]|uniref:Inner nuclear membrane protein Man1 n=1 Tax=Trichinella murrelli TaxID=144512 RepID=A0A0V0U3D9_9BILA|nr:Inner nuclear membrane protein Man1 [Trichinella murrelli]